MGAIPDSPLGKPAHYPVAYDAALLYPVERAPQREALGMAAVLPFHGADRWTAWEATWLDNDGRPQVAIAAFTVPCTSARIVESKSVKLYFASLNHERFDNAEAYRLLLARDLAAATLAKVDVSLHLPQAWRSWVRSDPEGVLIDDAAPRAWPAVPDAGVLRTGGGQVAETLVTHAFRSVCPVTGQPDYASVSIAYRGACIDRASLLAYLVGFRRHPGFHEHCVERIYVDVAAACRPLALAVEARFTRRGGIDINPFRSSEPDARPAGRPTLRQ